MSQLSNKPNRQSERSKTWIFEALMILMNEKPYDTISVSDIAEKAGIARTTFYRNFNDKDDVLIEYLAKSIKHELLSIEKLKKDDKFKSIVLMFDYDYMIKHKKNLKKILSIEHIENRLTKEMQNVIAPLVKHYRNELSEMEFLIFRYKLCYQMNGSLRVIFDWFISDMPMPVENIVEMLNRMNIPKTIQYRNIPSVVVRFKNE